MDLLRILALRQKEGEQILSQAVLNILTGRKIKYLSTFIPEQRSRGMMMKLHIRVMETARVNILG